MDDIYSDLENYNDANIVSELRNENKQLKLKLEEYTSTINKLQKDFDKLNSEHKRLELNYSSLLKTAKAEIERKTSMITQLNIEKDMLVINSIQTTGKNILRSKQNMFGNTNYNNDKNIKKHNNNSVASKGHENKPKLTEADNGKDCHPKRWESDKQSPITSISSAGTVTSTCSTQRRNVTQKNVYEIKDKASIDLNLDTYGNVSKRTGNKIMDRRKSMPIISQEDVKFSSDEDMLDSVEAKDENLRLDTRHGFRSSRLEDSQKYHESSRDKNKAENTKETHHYKNRRYSSERDKKRTSRTSAADNSKRSDNRRQRQLESPPSNKYNRSKSRDHRSEIERRDRDNRSKSRDRKNDIERRARDYRSKSRDRRIAIDGHDRIKRSKSRDRRIEIDRKDRHNRSKSRDRRIDIERRDRDVRSKSIDRMFETERRNYTQSYQQKQCLKNRRSDFDEHPLIKRRRTETYDFNDGWRTTNINENLNVQPETYGHTTCQSPDYDHLDHNPPQHVREIIHTATMKLDDPRITSKKYVLKKKNGITSFSRMAKEVEIKPINKSIWGFEKVDVPEALKMNPSAMQISDNLVKEIYMDIENPCSNMSLESGELHSLDNEENNKLLPQSADEFNKQDEVITSNQNKIDDILKTQESECSKRLQNNEIKTTESTKSVLTSYKIPKVQKTEKDRINTKTPKSCENINNNPKADTINKTLTSENPTPLHAKKHEEILPIVEKYLDGDNMNLENKSDCQKTLSVKDIEGDLELSDEEGDGEEVYNNTIIQVKNKLDESRPLVSSLSSDNYGNSIQEPTLCTETRIHSECNKNSNAEKSKSQSSIKKATTDFIKESKKHKSKKSRQDHKKIDVPLDDKNNLKNYTDNKLKGSQLNKNKFCELFGDSSSLITPDELGIPETEIVTDKYTSVFDDTQDAIDLSLEEMEKIKRKLELKIDKLSNIEGEEIQTDNSNRTPETNVTDQKFNAQQTVENLENLNLEVTDNKASAVKTVIISTGIQPTNVLGGNTLTTSEIDNKADFTKKNALDSIKALATSTPLKVNNEAPKELSEPNSSSASNTTNTLPLSNSPSLVCAPKCETDAPDMRIFVKRRRKIKKP